MSVKGTQAFGIRIPLMKEGDKGTPLVVVRDYFKKYID